MKNIEWLKGQLKYLEDAVGRPSFSDYSEGLLQGYKNVDNLIDQLDELGYSSEDMTNYYRDGYKAGIEDEKSISKTKLPEIPDYVAEYIAHMKEEKTLVEVIYLSLEQIELGTGGVQPIDFWISRFGDKFSRAWLNGYTVEEKKYVVQVAGGYYLGKEITKGIMLIDSEGQNWSQDEVPSLTEKEIKDHNPRFWPFAREVTK